MKDDNNIRTIFNYFLEKDISTYNFNVEKTDIQNEINLVSLSKIEEWVCELLNSEKKDFELPSTEIGKSLYDFAGIRHIMSSVKIGLKLTTMGIEKKHTKKEMLDFSPMNLFLINIPKSLILTLRRLKTNPSPILLKRGNAICLDFFNPSPWNPLFTSDQ